MGLTIRQAVPEQPESSASPKTDIYLKGYFYLKTTTTTTKKPDKNCVNLNDRIKIFGYKK